MESSSWPNRRSLPGGGGVWTSEGRSFLGGEAFQRRGLMVVVRVCDPTSLMSPYPVLQETSKQTLPTLQLQ